MPLENTRIEPGLPVPVATSRTGTGTVCTFQISGGLQYVDLLYPRSTFLGSKSKPIVEGGAKAPTEALIRVPVLGKSQSGTPSSFMLVRRRVEHNYTLPPSALTAVDHQ